jgi:hypothetical protein
MRYLFCVILILMGRAVSTQVINIPDPKFKNALVNTNCVSKDSDSSPDADPDFE